MDTFQILTIISCVMSTITAVAICIAILPHIQKGIVVVRDAVLWAAFVLLVFGCCWVAFLESDTTADDSPGNILHPILKTETPNEFYAGK